MLRISGVKVIELLRSMHDEGQSSGAPRRFAEHEAEMVEVVRRKLAVASEADRAKILQEEGLSAESLIQLDLDDDVRETIERMLR